MDNYHLDKQADERSQEGSSSINHLQTESIEENRDEKSVDRNAGPGQESNFGFLELIYGILFNPTETMKIVAINPPLLLALLIVTMINLLNTLLGTLLASRFIVPQFSMMGWHMDWVVKAVALNLAVFAFFFRYLKWLIYSSFLHLVAEFYGGKGKARTVFTVYGLAGLPAIFLIPVQLLVAWIGPHYFFIAWLAALAGLGIFVWSVVLLVIGLAEAHQINSGRATAVVFTPVIALLVLGTLVLITISAMVMRMPWSQVIPPMMQRF